MNLHAKFGVAFGAVQIIGFSIIVIYSIVVLCKIGNIPKTEEYKNDKTLQFSKNLLISILVVCLVAVGISALLIVGIIKKRYCLMTPWLICAIVSICLHFVRIFFNLFTGFYASFFIGFLILCLQGLVFYPIFTTYRDIRNGKTERVPTDFDNCHEIP